MRISFSLLYYLNDYLSRTWVLIAFAVFNIQSSVNAQNCTVSIVKYPYTNGFATFSVCNTNPIQSFAEDQTIHWYSTLAGLKSTNGGCAGKLLHGLYQFSDENGNLIEETNYTLGVQDGKSTTWDKDGNIIAKSIYEQGTLTYTKFKNDEGLWVEWIGKLLSPGSVKRVYSKYNLLLQQDSIISLVIHQTKDFFPISGNLKSECTTYGFGDSDCLLGEYREYYDNNQLKVSGKFYEPLVKDEGDLYDILCSNIKEGLWSWYNFDGTIDAQEKYRSYVSRWESGELKECGQMFWDKSESKWVKHGVWKSFDDGYSIHIENAESQSFKYSYGILIEHGEGGKTYEVQIDE
ncbi:MAG: hypothetical protein K9G46_11120 [Flavobacteriales bacterium]|nr:hypothetical protein [Flavobacteriales bacterium]